jgi:hypothetical protein
MKEPYRKGEASHPDPESCAASRKAGREAVTGAHAGRVSSCEINVFGVPTPSTKTEGYIDGSVNASIRRTPRSQRPLARIETPHARTGRPHQRPTCSCERAGWRRA